jgi:hypothetical protein
MSDLDSISLADIGLVLHCGQYKSNAIDAVRAELLLLLGFHGHRGQDLLKAWHK